MSKIKQIPITKERLKKYRYMMIEIENQLERSARKRERLESPLQSIIKVLSSKQSNGVDHVSANVAQVLDLEQSIDAEIKSLIDEVKTLEAAVSQLDDPCEREVLRLRYFERKGWREISRIMHFETATVYRVHGLALLHIRNLSGFSQNQIANDSK